jgi:hypothetical protein
MCYHKVLNGFPNLFPKKFKIAPQFVPHAFPNIILLEPMKEREHSIMYIWSDNFYIEESPKFQNSFELGLLQKFIGKKSKLGMHLDKSYI